MQLRLGVALPGAVKILELERQGVCVCVFVFARVGDYRV